MTADMAINPPALVTYCEYHSRFGRKCLIRSSTYTISNTTPCRIHLADIKPTVLAKTQLSFGEWPFKLREKWSILKDFWGVSNCPKAKFKSKLSKFLYYNSCTNFHGQCWKTFYSETAYSNFLPSFLFLFFFLLSFPFFPSFFHLRIFILIINYALTQSDL